MLFLFKEDPIGTKKLNNEIIKTNFKHTLAVIAKLHRLLEDIVSAYYSSAFLKKVNIRRRSGDNNKMNSHGDLTKET